MLEQLAGFYAGQRVVLLWDGLISHWSYRMPDHLDAQRALADRGVAAAEGFLLEPAAWEIR